MMTLLMWLMAIYLTIQIGSFVITVVFGYLLTKELKPKKDNENN